MSITLTQLTYRYPGTEVPAVKDVSLSLDSDTTWALVGATGSGKSTLLALLAGVLAPDAGEISLGNQVVSTPQRVLAPERRDLGLLFQDRALWNNLTVREHLELVERARRKAGAGDLPKVPWLIDRFGLSGLEGRRPAELSGGQQQCLALARVWVGRFGFVLLDEPLQALDRSLRDEFSALLQDLRKKTGCSLGIVTHDYSEAQALADIVVLLDAGQVVQIGTPSSIYCHPVSELAARLTGRVSFVDGTWDPKSRSMDTSWGSLESEPIDHDVRIAVRPEQLSFEPGAGSARVVRQFFSEGRWLTEVEHGSSRVWGLSQYSLAAGTTVVGRFVADSLLLAGELGSLVPREDV